MLQPRRWFVASPRTSAGDGRVAGMDLQALARNAAGDDSLRALGHILEAWDEGEGDGIAPELMAYAAIYAALTDLVGAYGEDAVSAMATGLAQRIQDGEFTLARRQ